MVSPEMSTHERIQAEASAWLARLNNDDRAPETEAAFQEWLHAAPEHEAAFDRVRELWELLPGAAAVERAANDAPSRRKWVLSAASAAAVVLAIAGGYAWTTRPIVYETAHGQQQMVTLRDGSRLSLNTDSAVAVAFSAGRRQVELKRGEVLFDVAHNPKAPFTVKTGDEQVLALGTAFVVRRNADQTLVTLIRGRVSVSRVSEGASQQQAILSPGERAIIDGADHLRLDRPSIEAATAWQRGEVVFADTRLDEAAAELNRYGPVRIVVADTTIARLRVSGIFETNNAPEFAAAMAQLNGLKVRRSGETIELVR
jgi:transmembrane sensor